MPVGEPAPLTATPRLGVVVPAKDPGPRFAAHLGALHALLDARRAPTELIVVDDGSRSPDVRDTCARLGVRCIVHEHNLGKGAALRTGFTALLDEGFAGADLIGFIDADGDIPARYVAAYADQIATAAPQVAALVGSKTVEGSHASVPLWRRLASRVFSVYAHLVMPTSVSDTQVGVKVFRAAFLREALPLTTTDRFLLDVELLAAARRRGWSVHTAAVSLAIDASTSTVGLATAWRMARELAALSVRARRGRRYGVQHTVTALGFSA